MNKDKVILLCLQPHKSFRGREFSHFTEQVVAKFPQRVLLPEEHLKTLGKVIATAASEVTQQGKGREGEARKGTTPPDPRAPRANRGASFPSCAWRVLLIKIKTRTPSDHCISCYLIFLMEGKSHEGFINSFTDANPRPISPRAFKHFAFKCF